MSMNLDIAGLIRKYDRPVPRYTSYPTAVRFAPDVGTAEHERWLAAVPPEKPVSLYIHIPFCRTLCFYCGCHTGGIGDNYNPVAAYLKALVAEIERVAGTIGRRQAVSHIHLGGGTPTILNAEDLKTLFSVLRRAFAIEPQAEIAVEIDPRLVGAQNASDLAELGVTRVSLGVQDFDAAVQKAIGRVQPYEQVVEVTRLFREAGIGAINFDMMYGLPLQTTANVLDNARKVAALRPGRIALFGYAHVPWMKKNQKVLERYPMPDAAERYGQFAASGNHWLAQGYRAIGIDHFALPDDGLYKAYAQGTLHRNFMGYTTDRSDTILGFGASAISAFPQGYTQNQADTRTWIETAGKGEGAAARGLTLRPGDYPRRDIIGQLMCYGRADCSATGIPPALSSLQQDGLVKIGENTVEITETGRPFTRIICSTFDEYCETTPQRHAKAV